MTGELREHETFAPTDKVHGRRFDDELVILDLTGGEYYALNATGARVWECLTAGNTLSEIARTLSKEFDVDYDRAMSDCLAVTQAMLERGLLRRGR